MNDAIRGRLASIAARWNTIEGRLKRIELVRGEAVLAAVNELRYTGRRIVDALVLAVAEPPPPNLAEAIERELNAAEIYLNNADHDLTDAVLLYTVLRIGRYIDVNGRAALIKAVPEYKDLEAKVKEAKELVILSRQDRTQRKSIYDKMATDFVPSLLELDEKITAAESLTTPSGGLKRGLQLVSSVAFIGSLASIFGLMMATWIWYDTPNPGAFVKMIVHDVRGVFTEIISVFRNGQ